MGNYLPPLVSCENCCGNFSLFFILEMLEKCIISNLCHVGLKTKWPYNQDRPYNFAGLGQSPPHPPQKPFENRISVYNYNMWFCILNCKVIVYTTALLEACILMQYYFFFYCTFVPPPLWKALKQEESMGSSDTANKLSLVILHWHAEINLVIGIIIVFK